MTEKLPPPGELPVVWIEWLDSVSHHGWRHVTDIDLSHKDAKIVSVGFLVEQTDAELVISSSHSTTGNLDSPMSIPLCAIKRWHYLEIE